MSKSCPIPFVNCFSYSGKCPWKFLCFQQITRWQIDLSFLDMNIIISKVMVFFHVKRQKNNMNSIYTISFDLLFTSCPSIFQNDCQFLTHIFIVYIKWQSFQFLTYIYIQCICINLPNKVVGIGNACTEKALWKK